MRGRLSLCLLVAGLGLALVGCVASDSRPVAATAAPEAARADGCRDDMSCDMGQYCHRTAGQCAAAGECRVRPQLCAQHFRPVCGCDGMGYSNACVAYAAGTSVAAEGPCASGR